MVNNGTKWGWASSAFYYFQLARVNQWAAAMIDQINVPVESPTWETVNSQGGTGEEGSSIDGYRPLANTIMQQAIAMATNGAGATKPNSTTSFDATTASLNPFAGLVNKFLEGMTSGNPLLNTMSLGETLLNTGETIATMSLLDKVSGAVKGVVALISAPETAGASLLASALVSAVGKLALPVAAVLIVEGGIFMYVIPMMPSFAMVIAIVGTIMLVLEMIVATPVWMVAHAYAGGDDFAPQQASYGYGALIGVLMRPIALTFGFVFMYYLLNVALWFMGTALAMAFGGMTMTSVVGPVAAVFLIGVILGAIFMVIRIVVGMVTHLADNIPNWMGGRSTNVPGGREAVHEAQGMQGTIQRTTTAGGVAIRQMVREGEAEKKAAAEKRASQAREEATQAREESRHREMIDALTGGEKRGRTNDGGGPPGPPGGPSSRDGRDDW
jgi:conjugal transfer/type IV secretion protein DotA/TraY